jgi:hypothetical protein
MIDPGQPIVVTGPARAETVGVLRAIAATVAARSNMDVAAIEEFRIAVDEAATLLLLAGTASRLEMSLYPDEAGVDVRVHIDRGSTNGIDTTASWPWRVISQLTRGAELSSDERGAQVTFAVGGVPGA